MLRLGVAVAALGALALAGCADLSPSFGPGVPVISVPHAGDRSRAPDDATRLGPGAPDDACVQGRVEDRFGDPQPDLTAVVDCADAHEYEIVGYYDLPDDLIDPDGSTDEVGQQIDALLGAGGSHADAFLPAADSACSQAAGSAAGLTQRLNGVDPESSGLTPFGLFDVEPSIPPASAIASGSVAPRLTCSIRYVSADDATTVLQPGTGRAIGQFLTAQFPDAQRLCWAYDEVGVAFGDLPVVPCAEQHWLEPFAEFDAEAVFGEDFVDEWVSELRSGDQPSDAEWDATDGVCAQDFDGIVPSGYDAGISSWTLDDWSTTDSPSYRMVCALSDPDYSDYDVTGSFFDATAPSHLLVSTDQSGA